MKTLIVLRHSKAAQVPGLADRERPLTDRGENDAKRAGDEIRAQGLTPDTILCSPAKRTRQTAELAFPGEEITYERDVYEAYAEELLALLQRQDGETIVLCGHNPAVAELVLTLTRGSDTHMRPGAFAVIETDSWVDLWPGEGRLVSRWDPKEN